MTTINDTAKSLPLPLFDGETTKFKGWWMRFRAYATIKNFSLAIQRTKEADLPDKEDEDVSADNKKRLAKQRNLMAISCLTMAFQDDALLNILEQSETSDWPSGLVYIVIDELFKKYKPVRCPRHEAIVGTYRWYPRSRYTCLGSPGSGFSPVWALPGLSSHSDETCQFLSKLLL